MLKQYKSHSLIQHIMQGWGGLIGGLEVLGEIVLSSETDKAWLDPGEIDYFRLSTTLASVRTPLELE